MGMVSEKIGDSGRIPVKSTFPGNPLIEVQALNKLDDLPPLADAWNSLCLQNPDSMPQLSYAMVCSWLQHRIKPEDTWMVLVARCDQQLVGVLPLIIRKRRCLGLNLSVAMPPQDPQINSVDMVAVCGSEPSIFSAFLQRLKLDFPSISEVLMYRIPENGSSARALITGPNDYLLKQRPTGAAACYEIKGTFDSYMESLKPNFSRNLRRLRRKFESMDGSEFVSYAGSQFTEEQFDRFLKLEASGWKGEEQGAILSSPTATSYYREAFRQLRELGWPELYTMQVDGAMIAAQFAVRLNRNVFMFKICYSEEHSSLGPGNVLMADTIERAYQRGDTDEINCLTDMPWHTNWVVTRRPYTTYTLVPNRILPMAAKSVWASTKLIKSVFARIF
jgi:CelD/BcsL family acetyltransferase involved in cellulose biosynthesis